MMESPRCEDCGTVMLDAGYGIGFYCPNFQCPGDEKSLTWAREQVDLQSEREAIELLRKRGYSVEKK